MTPETSTRAAARRVLLVDDEPAFLELLKDFLLSHRPGAWTVHTAEGYSSALACLKQNTVDLVILDLNMPVMDGLQFLTLLKRSYPGLQVVILTARATPQNRNFCLHNGAALFLDKLEIANGFEKIYDALESVAASPVEGFRGMLRQVGLPEVLQLECLGRKSSVFDITGRNAAGRIYIQDGTIIHAECGTLQGEPALFQLLSLKGGEFQLKPFTAPPRLTIDGHWESLLMEAARLQDEAAGAATETAAEAAPATPLPEIPPQRSLPAIPPPPRAEPMERTVEEIVLCSGNSEVLYAWQTAEVERRVRLLDQLARRATGFAALLPLGQPDRLDIEIAGGRIIALLQPERKIFVHIGFK